MASRTSASSKSPAQRKSAVKKSSAAKAGPGYFADRRGPRRTTVVEDDGPGYY